MIVAGRHGSDALASRAIVSLSSVSRGGVEGIWAEERGIFVVVGRIPCSFEEETSEPVV
jgi:hypothetical protein